MIGVFDSGVGGLSVLREIRRQLPGEPLLYVADSGHAPYGDRSADFIEARSTAIVEFLVEAGARAIVIACNTATVVAVRALRAWCPVPIVAMEPAIKPAVSLTRSGVVGVLATRRTLESPSVARLCERHGHEARILLQACPGLVDRVEQGDLQGAATRGLLESYVGPLLEQGADTLVLGCTHYPFLEPLLRELAGPGVSIVDPAGAVARELQRRLGAHEAPRDAIRAPRDALQAQRDALRAQRPGPPAGLLVEGGERFLSSGALVGARAVMSALWGRDLVVDPLPVAPGV
ncbi:MAG TPA: glutamate racemase [Quisquiliibacterium sp.]|nr:glutamate racemase [Quisquiliibacterium sp.]